jgi:cytochrome c peroxidase
LKFSVPVGVLVLLCLAFFLPVLYLNYTADEFSEMPEPPRQPERFNIPGNRLESLLEEPAGTPEPTDQLPDYRGKGIDRRLLDRLKKYNVRPLSPRLDVSERKMRLGRWLFWEKELSGNRDLSCGICHNPTAATTDQLSLSIGPHARGDSIGRDVHDLDGFMARNALALFNRGQKEWRRFFWDGRVSRGSDGSLRAPLPRRITTDFDDLLELLVVIPPVRNDELRGESGDVGLFGQKNKIANLPDTAFRGIWGRYLDRLRQYSGYREYFRKVYPSVDEPADIHYTHVADALASFIEVSYTLRNSPWDRYLAGRRKALDRTEKEGALLFYGKARCAECHAGPLMTDQEFHNIGVPHLGPGRKPHEPFDLGAFTVTEREEDRFAFRTPPLRNVSLTGPWMHNGAYKSLEGAVRHHLRPERSLRNYDKRQLGRDIQRYHRSPNWTDQLDQFPRVPPGTRLIPTVKDDPGDHRRILRTLSPELRPSVSLSEGEFDKLMEFLFALTSPTLVEKRYRGKNAPGVNLIQLERRRAARMTEYNQSVVPDTTPSGIPVDCVAEWCLFGGSE